MMGARGKGGGFKGGGGKGGGGKGGGGKGGGRGKGGGGGQSADGQAFFRPSFIENPWHRFFPGEPSVFDLRVGAAPPPMPTAPPPPPSAHPVADFLANNDPSASEADLLPWQPPKRSRLSLPPPVFGSGSSTDVVAEALREAPQPPPT